MSEQKIQKKAHNQPALLDMDPHLKWEYIKASIKDRQECLAAILQLQVLRRMGQNKTLGPKNFWPKQILVLLLINR